MQAPDGSSVGARAALLRLSIDLRLHPSVVATALDYAFDNHTSFPSASHALCFSIVSQGYCVNMHILDVALQNLRKNFGGVFGAPAAQRLPMGQWLMHSSARGYGQGQNSALASSEVYDTMKRPLTSFTANAPSVALWPMSQQRGQSLLSKSPASSTCAHSGNTQHNMSSMVEDAKFSQY